MKIFLSSLENNTARISRITPMKYNLISYYYGRNHEKRVQEIIWHSSLILIDSGAHTFQKGHHVDWDKYTSEYAAWIKAHDCEKIIGYFEMDVDNVIGYEKVLQLRSVLEQVSDKIIPVWHKGRGIANFQRMCQQYSGRIIAITGFKNEDIRDDQYLYFLKYAWSWGCRVHCLGMTRRAILDKVPFDFVDSSTWTQSVLYGRLDGRKLRNAGTIEERRAMRQRQWEASYLSGKQMQEHYEQKWLIPTKKMKRSLCEDG